MEDQTFKDEGELEETDTDFDETEGETNDTDTFYEDGEPKNSDDFLAKAKEITGRDFKDEEDFKKHYKNLSSFVGKKNETKKESKQVKTSSDDLVKDLSFKVDHPELKENFDVIKMVAENKKISYEEAISDTLVKEMIEVRQGKKGESVIHSNNKISSDKSSLSKLKQNANSVDGVAEYLSSIMEQ